jgi:hypothetical protein
LAKEIVGDFERRLHDRQLSHIYGSLVNRWSVSQEPLDSIGS